MIILERPSRRRSANPSARKTIRRPADVYALWLALLAVGALSLGCRRHDFRHPGELLLFVALGAAAGSQKLWMPALAPHARRPRSRLSLGYIFVIAGMILLDVPAAMLIAAASGLAGSLLNVAERPGLREGIFNVSASILSAALAGLAFLALGGSVGLPAASADLLPVCAAAVVYVLTDLVLAAAAVSLVDRRPLWERQGLFWSLSSALAGASLAILMALAFELPDHTLFYLSLPLVSVLFAAYRATLERMDESRQHVEDLDRSARELYASFLRVGQALAAPLDARALHQLIVDLCHEMLAPQMSVLCLWSEENLHLTATRFASTFPPERSGSVAEALQKAAAAALERGQPMSTPTEGLRPGGAGAIAFAVPLRSSDLADTPWVGALCVLYDPWVRLTGARRQFLTGFATQVALALQNARLFQAEQSVADTMRRSLLPPAHVEARGLEIGPFYEPLAFDAGCIGGDYYDVFTLPDGQIVVSIADVCGKGMAAAVRTALFKYTIRAYAVETSRPRQVLARANAAFIAQEPEAESFTTLACALLDPRNGSLALSAAGHPPALLYRAAAGRCVRLNAGGAALGLLPGEQYDEVLGSFGPGDVLLLYTDGLLEARSDDEEFGLERLEAEFARLAAPAGGYRGAREIAMALVEAGRQFANGKLADDVTLLVVRNACGDEPARL